MTIQSCAKVAGAVVTFVAIVLAAMSVKAPRANADDDDTDSRIRIGFEIGPRHFRSIQDVSDQAQDFFGLTRVSYDCTAGCEQIKTNVRQRISDASRFCA